MSDPKNPASNVGSIEEYLKGKYQFLNEKSPYSQPDFLQKPDEKPLVVSSKKDPEKGLPIKSHDETLDITVFRDLQLNNKDPETLYKKYENRNKDEPNFQSKPQKEAGYGVSSDPKITKLLADVENIVQKATGKGPTNYDNGSSEPNFGQGIKFGQNKKNSDIENHEIRAYLKNLDSKLNIIAPKKDREEKENQSKQCDKSKKQLHKEDSSFSETDTENSPAFRQKGGQKNEPKSTTFMNNRNSVNRDGKKQQKSGHISKETNCSPTKTSEMPFKAKRSNSKHIFGRLPPAENRSREISEMDKNLTRHALHQKALLEIENNVFCVNCEEFINENKIDEHSLVCHKSSSHRIPNNDNHYNSLMTGSMEANSNASESQTLSVAGQIKNVNEHLNKATAILLQKIKFFENLMNMPTCDLAATQQIAAMLANFLEFTLNLIHNKDPITISQISKILHELFVNLSENTYVSPDVLQILQKIKQYCRIKYEILDPNNNYYNVISSTRNPMYNPVSLQRFSTTQNFQNRLNSYLSDTQSNATFNRSNNTKVYNNMNSPSDNSNGSDIFSIGNSKTLKKKFFKIAISTKLALPKGHPGHQVNLSDLFVECLQMRLAENEWEEFLEQKLNLYT